MFNLNKQNVLQALKLCRKIVASQHLRHTHEMDSVKHEIENGYKMLNMSDFVNISVDSVCM